jgi:hypothetical protein
MEVGGAGDCERGVLAVLFCCGGPLAQADFDGSWGGFFGVDAVADLLILTKESQQGEEGPNLKRKNRMCRGQLGWDG